MLEILPRTIHESGREKGERFLRTVRKPSIPTLSTCFFVFFLIIKNCNLHSCCSVTVKIVATVEQKNHWFHSQFSGLLCTFLNDVVDNLPITGYGYILVHSEFNHNTKRSIQPPIL